MTESKSAPTQSAFARDVEAGLSKTPKKLPSKYFYDAKGDVLFQQIMNMPEYYLTDCEFDIFRTHKNSMLQTIGHKQFDLVELGAGDGTKTMILLDHFLEAEADFQYFPVDISANVLQHLSVALQENWPTLEFECLAGDYFEMLDELHGRKAETPKVLLFLGANIGNLLPERAEGFLRRVNEHIKTGDMLITGFDLKKDPDIILNAYSDPAGITAAFNLNLLRRINRELDADFDLNAFRHFENYDPITGATRSFIVSKKAQRVNIGALQRSFDFEAWEAMDVELSQKFSLSGIEQLAARTGFRVRQNFSDSRNYFVDSVWIK